MKRLYVVALLLAVFCFVGCEVERAQYGDFKLLTDVKDGKIILGYEAGSTATIDIMARYDWEILPTKGFACTPNSGRTTESTRIDIRALRDNNSVDTVKLDNLYFRLLNTRFTGITVHQLPRMTVERRSVILSSTEGATNSVYVNTDEEFEVVYDESQPFTAVADNANGVVRITSLSENNDSAEQLLGTFTLRLVETPSCKVAIKVYQRFSETPQTIFYYFVGTSLLYNYRSNIDDVLSALSANIQGKSRVIVLLQDSTNKAGLYELRYDTKQRKVVNERVRDITLTTPYNAALLTSILGEVIAYAPAEKYGLIFGSHGTGWIQKDAVAEGKSVSGLFGKKVQDIWQQRREDALPTRYIGDDSPSLQYDLSEIGEAVKANNIDLEYILFDACFMGNIESAYELRDVTKYVVGSPCEVMAQGFPYKAVLPMLLKENGTTYDLDAACKAYVDTYQASYSPWACVSMVVTSELESLALLMKSVNAADRAEDFSLNNVQYFEGMTPHIFYDLEDYVRQSCADESLVEQFKAQMAKTVVSRYHTKKFYTIYGLNSYIPIDYYSGVTTSAGSPTYHTAWKDTAWYKDTQPSN